MRFDALILVDDGVEIFLHSDGTESDFDADGCVTEENERQRDEDRRLIQLNGLQNGPNGQKVRQLIRIFIEKLVEVGIMHFHLLVIGVLLFLLHFRHPTIDVIEKSVK